MNLNYLYIDGILDFKEAQFQLNDINIFLGANNTGKSSVFRILELLQNSLDIYKEDGINLNFEDTKLANIKNINTDDLITFKLPFYILGSTIIELQYNNNGRLVLLAVKYNDIPIIKMKGTNCSIDFERIIQYLDDEFLPQKTTNTNLRDRFKFIGAINNKRQKVDRSALSLVEEKLTQEKNSLKKIWENSLLEEKNDNDINKSLELISSTETELMSSLSHFLNNKGDFSHDIGLKNSRRYSYSIVNIFNFLSELEALTSKQELLPYERELPVSDDEGNFSHVEIDKFDFLEDNKDAPLFSKKFKYLLDFIRLSLEKGFLDLIELLNDVSYLSAIRLNTISPYIDDSNNGTLNKLSKEFFYAKLEQKSFVNKWLKELQLGKIETEKKSLVGLEIKALIFYKFKNGEIDSETAFTLNKISTGTLQIIVLLMKISLSKKDSILCIEEPETNLHPRLQTTIADILKDANEKLKIKFIVETHNEYMLSRFQNLIAEETISREKLSIHNFQTSTDSKPQVVHVPIQEDGSVDYSIIYDDEYYPQGYNLHLSLLNKRRERFIDVFEKTKNLAVNNGETNEEDIYKEINNYLKNQDYSIYEAKLNELIGIDMSTVFSHEIISLLTSGLFLQNNLSNTNDFSPAVMQLGKAVENTIGSACANIFTINNIGGDEILDINYIEDWLFDSLKSWLLKDKDNKLKIKQNNKPKIQGINAQHLLYALAEPRTRTIFSPHSYNLANVLDRIELERNKNKFKENDLVSTIRDLRNYAAHKSEKISIIDSNNHLANVIEFFKMWIDIKV